ncbi:uncharacterized protein [Macrobrachium rosenbergii]|uniref:uncharacterized protein n=1 Tax=Macrobrachium rosenbergii TaxID=79674 RepID=UPI0034D47807
MYNLCCNYRKCIIWILELALICCLTMRHFFQKCFPSKEPGNFRELLKDKPSNAAGKQDRKSTFFPAFDSCVVEKQPLPTEESNRRSSHSFTVENNRHSSLESSSPVEKFRKQLSLSLTSLVELNKPEAFHSSEVEKDCAISTHATGNEGATVSQSPEKGNLQSSQPPVRDEVIMPAKSPAANVSAKSPMTPVKENTVVSSQTPDKDDPVVKSESQVTDNKTKSSQTSEKDDVSTSLHTIDEADSSSVIQTSVEYKSDSSLLTIVKNDSGLSFQTPFKEDPAKTSQESLSSNNNVEVDLALPSQTPAEHDPLASSQAPVEKDLVIPMQSPVDDDLNTLPQAADGDDFEIQSQRPKDDLDISSQMTVEENHNLVPKTPADGESPASSSNSDDAAVPCPAPAEENQTTASQPPAKEDTMTSSQLYAKNDPVVTSQSSVWKAQEKPYVLDEEELNPYSQFSVKEDSSSAVNNQRILQSDAKHRDKRMAHSATENNEIASSQTFSLPVENDGVRTTSPSPDQGDLKTSQESSADDCHDSKSEPLFLDHHEVTSRLSYDECLCSRSWDLEAKDTALQATNDSPKNESSTTTPPHICIVVVDVDESSDSDSEDHQDLKIAQLWNHSCDV